MGCESVFAGYTVTIPDDRFHYPEQRLVSFGLLADHVVAVVHTEKAGTIRIISIRKASRREQALYFEGIPL